MKITTKNIPEKEVGADVLILPVFEGEFPDNYSGFDNDIGNIISKVIKSGDFKGKQGQTMLLPVSGMNTSRILLAGLGKKKEATCEKVRRAGSKAFSVVVNSGLSNVALSVRVLNSLEGGAFSMGPAFYFLEGGLLGTYCFEKYLSADKKNKDRKEIEAITLLSNDDAVDIHWLRALVSATFFARDLINTPSNDMTPTVMAKIAKGIKGSKLKVRVLGRREIEKENMGAYLSVAMGSDEPPEFIIVEYMGGKGKPVVLIGKSVTFDSGGLDIKPGDGMEKMKYDMAGGAAVLAVIQAAASLGMPLHLVAILPAVENLLGGSAARPGDVVRTISGRTVEVISTDAEGRLTLADAIGYANKYMTPRAIIDIATLTGACNMAFGSDAIAMMGNDNGIMDGLRAASEEAYERVWPMPLFEEYGDYLKSDIADMRNVGTRKAALCSSAYFLKEFAGDTPWVHLDIAGAAWNDTERPYGPKGAAGIGVRLLLNYLKRI
jgi:leucyl aminopeptidase